MVSARKPRAQSFKRKTDTLCETELLVLLLARSNKQIAQCQSVGDRLHKCVRGFRYSDWLHRKSILKLANWSLFAGLRYTRARKRRSIRKLYEESLTPFLVLMTKEHFGQISWETIKSTHPFNSLEARIFTQKVSPSFTLLQFSKLITPQAAQTLFVIYVHDSIALCSEPFRRM